MTSLGSQRRAVALFKAFDGDFLLREQFVTDPAQILAEYVDGARLSSDVAPAANQMLYAVLSDPTTLRWVQSYAATHRGNVPSGQAFESDFARAVSQTGDSLVVQSLIAAAKAPGDVFAAQAKLLQVLITVLGQSGGLSTGTEMSPGVTATEMSPGIATEASIGVSRGGRLTAGTEMSPGVTATEMSPGIATEASIGVSRGEFNRVGAVFAGTEMSPGVTATEMSPGIATEASIGIGQVDISSTFTSLVQFANELRAAGALNTLGMR